MPAARRGRTIGIVAASVAAHVVLLATLAIYVPRWRLPPPEPSGPPEAIIPVLIMPRVPPPAAAPGAQPTEIRLHRRPQRFAPPEAPVAPLVAPVVETPKAAATSTGPKVLNLPAQPEALSVNARNALRSRLGCANPDAVGLTREEREACENRFAAGARQAEFPGLGIDADKAAGLADAAARKESDYRYKRSAAPAAPGGRIGETATDLAKSLGNDRGTATTPF